jgi:hypothetical protein
MSAGKGLPGQCQIFIRVSHISISIAITTVHDSRPIIGQSQTPMG